MSSPSNVIPCLSYRDANAAIEWLCSSFGFEKRVVYPDDAGGVAHAELVHAGGMIMLGSAKNSEYGRVIRQPDQCDGFVTQSVYVITTQPDELYAKAKAAGASMIIELRDESYGSRGFTCRDREGHVWSFGTYDPWQAQK
jgi:uncharacterized glyoxalase superfamily protein PhnB